MPMLEYQAPPPRQRGRRVLITGFVSAIILAFYPLAAFILIVWMDRSCPQPGFVRFGAAIAVVVGLVFLAASLFLTLVLLWCLWPTPLPLWCTTLIAVLGSPALVAVALRLVLPHLH